VPLHFHHVAAAGPSHEAAEQLLQRCKGLDLARWTAASGESEQEMAHRFLRARKGNVEAAFGMLSNDVTWRVDNEIDKLAQKPVSEIAGVDEETLWNYFPAWHQGFDKQGRPVLYSAYGNCEVDTLCAKGSSVEKLLMYHVFQQEQCVGLLASQSELLNRRIETFFFVVDAKGWGLRLWTRKAMAFIKGMADIDGAHYPERLGQMYVINCPRALVWTYRVITSWVDPVTSQKIQLLGGPSEWQHLLTQHVDASQLCSVYGGNAPPPFDAHNMAGFSASGQPMTTVTVGARSDFRLLVEIPEGGFLTWCYTTESHDVKFGVYYAPKGEAAAPGKSECVVPVEKHRAEGTEVVDTLSGCKGGTYLLVWDNSYSMLRQKVVSYRIEAGEKPQDDQVVAPGEA